MKERRTIVTVVLGTLLLITLIIGGSYAYWRTTRAQTDTSTLNTTCLDIDLASISSGINLDTQFPITEEEGRKTEGYTFQITNKCDTYVSYDINLESLNSTAEADRLNLSYLDAILDDGNVLDLGSYKSTESVLKAADGVAYDTRTLTTDTIGPKDSATSIKEYTLRVWLDDSATNETMNKRWSGKISVSASPVIAENAVEKLTKLAETNTTEMFTDDTSDANIRYMGADPANYVDLGNGYYFEDLYYGYSSSDHINYVEYNSLSACQTGIEGTIKYNADCEKIHSKGEPILWRVIGVMNNVDDGTGTKETRLKVIRDEDLEYFPAWGTKCNGTYDEISSMCIGSEYGTYSNNWETASLNKTLNEAYYNSTKTADPNMLYSYPDRKNKWQYLNFSNTGFKLKSQSLIGDAVYYLGGTDPNMDYSVLENDTTKIEQMKDYYIIERSNVVYEGNPTTWIGKVGLMYPSDYIFATNGGSSKDRLTCITTNIWDAWFSGAEADEFADCKNNNWMRASFASSITPSMWEDMITIITTEGIEPWFNDNDTGYQIFPVLYLKSDVKIMGGNGTKSNPYKLGL